MTASGFRQDSLTKSVSQVGFFHNFPGGQFYRKLFIFILHEEKAFIKLEPCPTFLRDFSVCYRIL